MKIHLEQTAKIVHINGTPCRLWQGQTASGIPIHAYIALVGVDRQADGAELDRELREVANVRADLAIIPARIIHD